MNGVLGKLRSGDFDADLVNDFLVKLENVEFPETYDRELVSLIWYIPPYLAWNKEVTLKFSNVAETVYVQMENRIHGILENKIGSP